MPRTSPTASAPRHAPPDQRPKGFFATLFWLLGLDARGRAEGRALRGWNSRYRFAGNDHQAELAEARDHYNARLIAQGLDPAHYKRKILAAVEDAYDWSFDLGRYAPKPKPEGEPDLHPASPEYKRAEAIQTFHATGHYALPSYGGHILTKEERRQLGLFDYRLGD